MSSTQVTQPKFIEQKVTKVNGQVVIRKYQKLLFLGKGGFATCYLCENTETKRRYAIKIISKSILTKPKTKQKLLSEIRIHKSVSHKNIVQFYHVFEDEYFVYILLQVCSNANMFQLIRKRKKLTIPQAIYYIYQLIQALSYLHNNMIIHRDVKLGNLFINDKMELKLGDFGLASKLQFVGERKRTVCGTPNYIAPEIIQNLKGHSYEVDVWSTGVILYIFLNGNPPFETDNLQKTYMKIKNADFKPMTVQNKYAVDLIRKVLVVDPAKRYTFKQFLQHPFMNPQGGILKTLPLKSLTQIPNIKEHQKYSDEEMRMTRVNSITTLKPQNEYGLESIQDRQKEQSSKMKKSGSITSLFKSLISPTAKIQRSNSLQLLKNNEQKKIVSKSKEKQLIQSNSKKNLTLVSSVLKKKKELYVYKYKIQVIISYALTNGIIGTCEPKLKILYSKKLNTFYEITDNDTLRVIPAEKITQDIQNRRKKFLADMNNQYEQQQNYKDPKNIVYVKKVLKTQNVVLFKLSNNVLQASFPETENIMLVTQDQIILIPKGNPENMIRQKKDNYLECKKLQLIKSYRMIVEIMNRSKQ